MAKKNFKKDYSATQPVADDPIVKVAVQKPVEVPVEKKADPVTMPKVILTKKVKVKFLKPGMAYGYGVFVDGITELPLDEYERLEKAGVVVKIG
jgi:hypothetical protein